MHMPAATTRTRVHGCRVTTLPHAQVQRPGVVEAIGRDTFILRNLAALARAWLKLNTDLPALVDEWAASLFKELDYTRCGAMRRSAAVARARAALLLLLFMLLLLLVVHANARVRE